MKVRDVGQVLLDFHIPVSAEDRKSSGDSGRQFRRHMNELTNAEYEKHLRDLKDRIDEQGAIVAKRMDLRELEKYRRLIAELLNETTSNAYAYLRMDRFDARGRHQTFALIKKVNEKLDEMTAQLLNEQTDNICLLKMTEDIRGLLVDLFL